MNIVSYLNVSNQDQLAADSGFIFQKLLLEELRARGHKVALIAPESASGLIDAEVIPFRSPATKYHARFEFQWAELCSSMTTVWRECDVLLVNQPELAGSLKALSFLKSKRNIPVVSYFHYLPLLNEEGDEHAMLDPSLNDGGLGPWVLSAIRAAVECSDACIVGSEFGRGLLHRFVGTARTLSVIPPPVESHLQRLATTATNGTHLRLLYNHRLYNHYGTARVFDYLDRAFNHNGDFEIIVTAPTQHRSEQRRCLAPDDDALMARIKARSYVTFVDAPTRHDYCSVLSSVHGGLGPLRQAPLWSMAIADVLGAGRPVLAPDVGAYREVLRDCPTCLWQKENEFQRVMREWIDAPPKPDIKLAKSISASLSVGVIVSKFESVFGRVVPGYDFTSVERPVDDATNSPPQTALTTSKTHNTGHEYM